MTVENWGLIPYREAWERQKKIFQSHISDNKSEEVIAVCEHPHVYTVGFHGNIGNMLADSDTLARYGAECIRIERGGDITYHGPGQLVVYPLINLNRHHLGVKRYVEILENAVIATLAAYGIKASSNNNQIGVWLDWDTPYARKICAIGVKISHGATMHGLALNVNTDMNMFRLINPCGITDKSVTSMQQESGSCLDMKRVAEQLTDHLSHMLLGMI